MKAILLILFSILLFALSCDTKKNNSQDEAVYPDFLNELTIVSESEIKKGPSKDARSGYIETIKSARQYRYLCNSYPRNKYYSFWLYNLGLNLENIDQHSLAFSEFEKLFFFNDSTAFPNDIKRINTLSDLKELPFALQLKLAAKLNKIKKFNEISETYNPKNNFSMLQSAFAYSFMKDTAKSIQILKSAIQPQNHIRLQKRSSTTAGAVCLAYTMGQYNYIDTLSSWISEINTETPPLKYSRLNKTGEPDSYSKNQWNSSLAIINKFKEFSLLAKDSLIFRFTNLQDGKYLGTCRGFIDTIKVQISISENQITSINVLNSKEDRPQTAIEIIPQRILKSKGLMVDAVTSATVTSSAIIAAVAEAGLKALQ